MKQVGLREFLNSDELNKAIELYTYHRPAFHKRCREEVIAPVIDRINSSLGQENDPDYLVYAIESILSRI